MKNKILFACCVALTVIAASAYAGPRYYTTCAPQVVSYRSPVVVIQPPVVVRPAPVFVRSAPVVVVSPVRRVVGRPVFVSAAPCYRTFRPARWYRTCGW